MSARLIAPLLFVGGCSLVIDTDRSFSSEVSGSGGGADAGSGGSSAGGNGAGPDCEPGQRGCHGAKPWTCINGRVEERSDCSADTPYCLSGECTSCPAPGLQECENETTLLVCDADGRRLFPKGCPAEHPRCVDGVCRECTGEMTLCRPGEGVLYQCVSPGQWEMAKACREQERCNADNQCVANTQPIVRIEHPQTNSSFTTTSGNWATIQLEGSAYDEEDGPLSETISWHATVGSGGAASWTASVAGPRQMAQLENKFGCSGTTYTIFAKVTDSSGYSHTQTISVRVVRPPC